MFYKHGYTNRTMSKRGWFYSLHRQTPLCSCAVVDWILSIDLLFFLEEIQLNIMVAIINWSQINGGRPSWTTRAVNLQRIQILRIDREGMVDNVITHDTWCHFCRKCSPIVTNLRWQKTLEKEVLPCNILPQWFTSHQSYYYNGKPEAFMRKRSMLTLK